MKTLVKPIRVVTLWQPWASLIWLGLKDNETRHWNISYRGNLLIHAAKKPCNIQMLREYGLIPERSGFGSPYQKQIYDALEPFLVEGFPYGQIVAKCQLKDVFPMTKEMILEQSEVELLCGNWAVGRYAWKLENIQQLNPGFPYKGSQGLSIPSDDAIEAIQRLYCQ